ncbi:hypothetical protein MBLNU459_g3122t1 [Dothideomycetes sp. NU459]
MPDVAALGHTDSQHVAASGADAKMSGKADHAIEFARQSERLAQFTPEQERKRDSGSTQAVEAEFITAQDPVIVTSNRGRLPAVPVEEALKLNQLRDRLEDREPATEIPVRGGTRFAKDGTVHGISGLGGAGSSVGNQSSQPEASLRDSVPPARTNPLFPPLPTFGPPRPLRTLQCWFFRSTSAVLSFHFLLVIVLGAAVTSLSLMFEHIRIRLLFRNPDKRRPFFQEEQKRKKERARANKAWVAAHQRSRSDLSPDLEKDDALADEGEEFVPTEGGPDPLVCDVGYYARRVGLDVETFEVETEDGFIIELWHVYNPREYTQMPPAARKAQGPSLFKTTSSEPENGETQRRHSAGNKKYPVLMIHGLLQSAGAYCCTDDDSLAFYLAKSGYDVWLGNNRCGFEPRHTMLEYGDPRMWAWNIRQMGVMDLPALISRVLAETGFPKLGLVAHSQGTTQTLVALAKEQRPEIGAKISVFCALAPAAYAGPLIGKAYFKFMRVVTTGMFRCIFGIHAFIPFMMQMHGLLPARLYGAMGYRVFSFLFNWTDTRWEWDLRDRMFQFSPTYVSAESMRWWLGRECFARQKCILATREEGRMEDEEDEEEDDVIQKYYEGHPTDTERPPQEGGEEHKGGNIEGLPSHCDKERDKYAWYDEQFPPLALWVCGADDLVDGRRLLRRFDRGREPHVKVVHKKIIEGYEHLDVIWAMDAIDKVGKEVKEVIWRTASDEARAVCRTPTGCEDEPEERPQDMQKDGEDRQPRGGDSRFNIDVAKANSAEHGETDSVQSPTQIDATAGEWSQDVKDDIRESKVEDREFEVTEDAKSAE